MKSNGARSACHFPVEGREVLEILAPTPVTDQVAPGPSAAAQTEAAPSVTPPSQPTP